VILERCAAPGGHLPGYLKKRLRITAYLQLGVGVQAEFQEPEQVMEVYLPVPLGIKRQGQIDPGQLAGYPPVYEGAVLAIGPPLPFFHSGPDLSGKNGAGKVPPALFIVPALKSYVLIVGDVKIVLHHRITSGYFVEPGCTVTDPLAGYKDGKFDMKGQYNLFKRRGMLLPQEVVNKPPILPVGLGSGPIGDPGRLNHPVITSQIIHKTNKALVQHRELPVEYRFCLFHNAMGHKPPLSLKYYKYIKLETKVSKTSPIIPVIGKKEK
jgi:hypothetical protein